jgi:hypothetical protein
MRAGMPHGGSRIAGGAEVRPLFQVSSAAIVEFVTLSCRIA